MKRNLLRILSSLFFVSSLIVTLPACGDKEPAPEYFPPRADNRVYFIYMASDNSLYGYSLKNIDDIINTATRKNIGKGRILVFYDRPNAPTQLLEFKAGPDGKGQKSVLWEEPQGRDLNTALPSTFADALDLMAQYATAGGQVVDSYILDMWSHGDAWEQHSRAVAPRSVANDGNSFLELEDFVDRLPNKSDAISFDAVVFAQCYSASIEMLYLLSAKTDIVVGSAPEMPAYGMPYHKVIPYIFAPVFDHKGIVDAYCGFYDNMSLFDYDGQGYFWHNSGTMAAFDCNAFTPEFVTTMQNIYDTPAYRDALVAFTNTSNSSSGGPIGVQSYNYRNPNDPYMSTFKYFDVGDLVNNITGLDAGLRSEFWGHMNHIVAYKRTGGRVFYDSYPIDRNKFTGMSTYIMLDNSYYTSLNTKYARTLWYKRVFNN